MGIRLGMRFWALAASVAMVLVSGCSAVPAANPAQSSVSASASGSISDGTAAGQRSLYARCRLAFLQPGLAA